MNRLKNWIFADPLLYDNIRHGELSSLHDRLQQDTVIAAMPCGCDFTQDEIPVKTIKDEISRLTETSELKNYVILSKRPSVFAGVFVSNNVIDVTGKDIARIASDINWVFSGFGRNRQMTDDVFVIGDCHFFHKNIIKYCNRPWYKKLGADGRPDPDDDDVARMNDAMVEKWNSVITSDSQVVYVNGDFCMGNRNKVKSVFDRLNGRKRIVLGNHDTCRFRDYYEIGFERVYDKPVVIASFCMLSHEPMQWVKDGDVYMNVYAHVHTQEMYKDYTANSFCTSAERLGYTPIRFTEIFEKCGSVAK